MWTQTGSNCPVPGHVSNGQFAVGRSLLFNTPFYTSQNEITTLLKFTKIVRLTLKKSYKIGCPVMSSKGEAFPITKTQAARHFLLNTVGRRVRHSGEVRSHNKKNRWKSIQKSSQDKKFPNLHSTLVTVVAKATTKLILNSRSNFAINAIMINLKLGR